jgi:hypothetical protein
MRQRSGSAGSTPDVRGTIRKIADGGPYSVPATIDDPLIPGGITVALAEKGFPKHQGEGIRRRSDRLHKREIPITEFLRF